MTAIGLNVCPIAQSAPAAAPPMPVLPPTPAAAPPLFSLAAILKEELGADAAGGLPRVRVVDVGAMSLGEAEDVWAPLRHAGLCDSIVGFEPVKEECDRLNAMHVARPSAPGGATVSAATGEACCMRFLPHIVGDGSRGEFRECSASMTSSMLEPNIPLLRRFMQLEEVTTVVKRSEVQTRRLDDLLPEMGGRADFLKLDVQGYELFVLRGAERALRETLVVHTEVEFVELYEKQPLFAEVDQLMRSSGFVFHRFASMNGRPMKPMHLLANPLQPISQMLWADAVYVRDFWDLQGHSRDQLIRTALILHEVYHSYDAVHHVLAKLDSGIAKRYLETVLR